MPAYGPVALVFLFRSSTLTRFYLPSEEVESSVDCRRHLLPHPRDVRKIKDAPKGTVNLSSQFSHENVGADGKGPSLLRVWSELDPSVLEELQVRHWGLGVCARQRGLKGRPVFSRKTLSVQPTR